jgi:formylglycine-generating enzyme required for sulfatase activity
MNLSPSLLSLLLSAALCAAAGAVSIDTVLVGNPGNAAHGTGFGAVDYLYCIGTFEVTNSQYAEFLNAVDPTGANTLQLYSDSMSTDARGGINFNAAASDGSKFELKTGRGNQPVVYVSAFDSFRFANWLHNDQESGGTESGAYTLLGGTPTPSNSSNITRDSGASWFLPNDNEWYKAAYHKNDGVTANYWDYPTSTDAEPYSDQPPGSDAPTQSNTANFRKNDGLANGYDDGFAVTASDLSDINQNYLTDVGAYTLSISPYETYDQGGSVIERTETPAVSGTAVLAVWGGHWTSPIMHLNSSFRGTASSPIETGTIGFRVARLPLPADFGDFNEDGGVDAADYVVWRKGLGTTYTQDDFATWRANFGATVGSGAGARESDDAKSPIVPEPVTVLLLVFEAAVMCLSVRQFREELQ